MAASACARCSIGTTGTDFAEYRGWLEGHGVDTAGVTESALHHTARFVGTTDLDMNQIASFYPGAMSEDKEIDLSSVAGRAGRFDLVLIGASDPEAMISFTAQCRKHGIPFATDTSWQLARLDGEQVRDLVDGATYLFCNEYEATMTERKTGWTGGEICAHVGTRMTTLGGAGARIDRRSASPRLLVRRYRESSRRSRPAPATRSGPVSSPRSPGGCRWNGRRSSAT